jgi:hypothetical protein
VEGGREGGKDGRCHFLFSLGELQRPSRRAPSGLCSLSYYIPPPPQKNAHFLSFRILYCSLEEAHAEIETDKTRDAEQTEKETEPVACAHVADEACETTVATKTEDGPAPALLANHKLFRILKETGKINRQQVADLLSSEAIRAHNGGDATDMPNIIHGDKHACEQAAANAAAPLPAQVLSRLEALAARIDARGRAPLLPCTTQLGRAYLPAIRFLVSCVAPAAGAGGVEPGNGAGPAVGPLCS